MVAWVSLKIVALSGMFVFSKRLPAPWRERHTPHPLRDDHDVDEDGGEDTGGEYDM